MPGPNILCADQGPLDGGSASVVILKGGRFSTPIGPAQADMRQGLQGQPDIERAHLMNSVCWYKGRLYWFSNNSATPAVALIKVYNQAANTWDTVQTWNSVAVLGSVAGGLFVVNTQTTSYLVASFIEGSRSPQYARSTDGTSWTKNASGITASSDDFQVQGIAHSGLLFMHRYGRPSTPANRTSYDPATGGIASYSPSASTVDLNPGGYFKFDGRLFHIAGFILSISPPQSVLEEFKFGTWTRIFTAGVPGTIIPFGTRSIQSYSTIAAVNIDDSTVLLFGVTNLTGSTDQGLACYKLTLTGASGGPLTAEDVTSTYVPATLRPAVGALGDPNNYGIQNIGKGSDGSWYLAFSSSGSLTGQSLLKVIPDAELQDAGTMSATTAYSIPLALIDGGERRDINGTLPLIKPHPLSTAEGTTGLVQSFRVDGDPLIALHGAVGGAYQVGETVGWTGGSGVVAAMGDGVNGLFMHTLTGALPDGLLMTGGTSGATTTCTTSSGNGQAHTVRGLFFLDANGTGLGAPSPNAPSGYCTMVAGSGVNCTVSKGTGPAGSDEVVTDADDSGQVKSFEWDFLSDGVLAFVSDNVKLQASRV